MIKSTQLSFGWRVGQKASKEDLESFIKLLPVAILGLESSSHKIFMVNPAASDLTGFPQDSIIDLDIRNLLPDWNAAAWIFDRKKATKQPLEFDLQRYDQSYIRVETSVFSLNSSQSHLLLILDPKTNQVAISSWQSPGEFWQNWKVLASAGDQAELPTAIHQAEQAIKEITGATLVSIYKAGESSSEWHRHESDQHVDWLPASIPAEALPLAEIQAADLKIKLWVSGTRPENSLERLAQRHKLPFMALAPLADASGLLGFLLLAGDLQAKDAVISYYSNLVTITSALLGRHVLLEQIKSTTTDQDRIVKVIKILFENIESGTIILDTNLNIRHINPSAQRMLGYTRRPVTGQSIEKILIGDEDLRDYLVQSLNNKSQKSELEIRLYRRNGQPFQAKLIVYSTTIEDSPDRMIIFIQDRSQEELARVKEMQLEQRAILGEVTAIYAHEVRNPINNISTGLELLQMGLPAEDPNQAAITRMQQDCDRLEYLMKSILSYTRPVEYQFTPIRLETLLQSLLSRMIDRIERHNIRHSIQVGPGCLPILGNQLALDQLFSNLITNAIQAMGENGGELVIKIQPHDLSESDSSNRYPQYMEVYVIDSGPGIPPEIQERMFQPFYTTKSSGTGLGLAIAKRIVTTHRGSINVQSFPGATIFKVLLPTIKSDDPENK